MTMPFIAYEGYSDVFKRYVRVSFEIRVVLEKHGIPTKMELFYKNEGSGLVVSVVKAHPQSEEMLVEAVKLLGMILRDTSLSTIQIRCFDTIFAKLALATLKAG